MQLAGGGGDHHVVGVGEVAAGGEGLAEGGEREGDRAAGLLGEGRRPHRDERVARPGLGPDHRRQPVGGGAALDLGDSLVAAGPVRPGAAAEALEEPAEQDRLPLRLLQPRLGEEPADPLGGEVRVGRAEVEVEGRLQPRSPRPLCLGVDRPAVDRAGGVEDRLGDRRVGVDDPRQLLVAALQRHRRDQLGDHVAGAVADDVGAEDLAVLGVDDELDQAVFVVVDGRAADAAELLLADLDVVPGLLRGGLGEPDAGDLRVAEGRAGDQVLVDRVGLGAGGVLDRDDALLGGLVGERLGVDEVADRVDLRVRGPLVLVDLDLAVLLQLDPGLVEAEALDVGAAAAGDAEVVDLGRLVAVGELDRALAGLDVLDRGAGGDRRCSAS